jgi:hypothetical protein
MDANNAGSKIGDGASKSKGLPATRASIVVACELANGGPACNQLRAPDRMVGGGPPPAQRGSPLGEGELSDLGLRISNQRLR